MVNTKFSIHTTNLRCLSEVKPYRCALVCPLGQAKAAPYCHHEIRSTFLPGEQQTPAPGEPGGTALCSPSTTPNRALGKKAVGVKGHLEKNKWNKSCTFEGLRKGVSLSIESFYNKTQRKTISSGLKQQLSCMSISVGTQKMDRWTGEAPIYTVQPAFQGVSLAGSCASCPVHATSLPRSLTSLFTQVSLLISAPPQPLFVMVGETKCLTFRRLRLL